MAWCVEGVVLGGAGRDVRPGWEDALGVAAVGGVVEVDAEEVDVAGVEEGVVVEVGAAEDDDMCHRCHLVGSSTRPPLGRIVVADYQITVINPGNSVFVYKYVCLSPPDRLAPQEYFGVSFNHFPCAFRCTPLRKERLHGCDWPLNSCLSSV